MLVFPVVPRMPTPSLNSFLLHAQRPTSTSAKWTGYASVRSDVILSASARTSNSRRRRHNLRRTLLSRLRSPLKSSEGPREVKSKLVFHLRLPLVLLSGQLQLIKIFMIHSFKRFCCVQEHKLILLVPDVLTQLIPFFFI